MRRYLVTAVAILAFVAFLGAVLQTILALSRVPSVVISDTTCGPPCWNGIRPGITTADEVSAIIFGAAGIDLMSFSERMRGEDIIQTNWRFSPPAPDGTGRVYYIDGRAAAIVISTFGSVRLDEMLAKLGPASFSWNYCEGGSELSWTRTVLFWPEDGYALAVDSDAPCTDSDQVHLSPRDAVARVTYFEPTSFEEILQTRPVFGPGSERAMLEWEPWSPSELVP